LDGTTIHVSEGRSSGVPLDAVHQIANEGEEPLVTLHLYSPPLPHDQPAPQCGREVAVLGGGWCGAAMVWHLLRAGGPELRVHWVHDGGVPGLGVAFGTTDAAHTLNVPANKMSMDPSDPDDFVRFAVSHGASSDPYAMHPRRLYGAYIQHKLRVAIGASAARVRAYPARAAGVRREGGGWRVALDLGADLIVDSVVLATGHGPVRLPAGFAEVEAHPALIADVWRPGALDEAARAERLLVVGTGLTAIDVLLSLSERRRVAPVTVTSRHGAWPRPHLPEGHWTGPPIELDLARVPADADGLARWFEEQVAHAAAHDVPWQAVVGAARPHIPRWWARLDDAQRARFLSVHRPRWEVARHRVPASVHARRRAWRDSGWLRERVGGVARVADARGALQVTFTDGAVEVFDAVVLATGNSSDPRTFEDPLWRGLLAEGLAVADPHGLGVITDERGVTLDPNGQPTGLVALGGLQRPRWFESTAVPDLVPQVVRAVEVVAERP
jgi:uncharacterized NAD(P)/FAD-binding protein YdhS